MVEYLKASNRLIDCRNNALLQIGLFGAFRRSELVNLTWDNISFVPEGVEILITHSKTDQANEGQVCAIPHGNTELCPARALLEWQERTKDKYGYVFCRIPKASVDTSPLNANQVNIIIKSIAAACHLPDAEAYSSHSLRRGFATEASCKGAPFATIMRQCHWRHEGTVLGYIDAGKRFDQNPVKIVLAKSTK